MSTPNGRVSWNLGELTAPHVQEYLEEKDTILVPVGSNEQHGQHLPLSTDVVTALEISRRVSVLAGVLHTPAIWTGYSPHHMYEPGGGRGTVTLRSSTMQNLLCDVGRSLIHHGFNRIVFINGHHSNEKIFDPVLRSLRYETGALVCFVQPVMMSGTPIVDDVFADDPPEALPGWHASTLETSQDLAWKPELVQMERARPGPTRTPDYLPDEFHPTPTSPSLRFENLGFFQFPLEYSEFSPTGGNGDPSNATAEKGELSFQRWAAYIARGVAALERAKVQIHTRAFTSRAL